MLIKDLNDVTITVNEETMFQGSIVKLFAEGEALMHAVGNDIPNEFGIRIGKMYGIRIFRDKMTVNMDADQEELQALSGMLIDGINLIPDMPDEMKPLFGVLKACFPTSVEGKYTATYPDGIVNVDGHHIWGEISFPIGTDIMRALEAQSEGKVLGHDKDGEDPAVLEALRICRDICLGSDLTIREFYVATAPKKLKFKNNNADAAYERVKFLLNIEEMEDPDEKED